MWLPDLKDPFPKSLRLYYLSNSSLTAAIFLSRHRMLIVQWKICSALCALILLASPFLINGAVLSCKTHHKGKCPVEGKMVDKVAEADVEDH